MSPVSSKDREHFAAIATAERQSEEERIDAALHTPPGERILEGLRLGRLAPKSGAHLAEEDARADGQMELARRRLALGLR
jgi:hypothetical protein